MENVALPLLSLLFVFLSLLTSMRFILSREGNYWIIPSLISIILFLIDLDTLIRVLGGEEFDVLSFRSISLFLIAVLWYMMIITFHYALRYKVKANRFRSDGMKNRKEAEYLEKVERRKIKKEEKEKKIFFKGRSVKAPSEEKEWSDLFSD